MFSILVDVVGTIVVLAGWGLIGYGMWRNQRAAKDSELVDDTNFGPRGGAIVETMLHPDHAAVWMKFCSEKEAEITLLDEKLGTHRYLRRVFPAIGQDSSEQYGIRPDDGIST